MRIEKAYLSLLSAHGINDNLSFMGKKFPSEYTENTTPDHSDKIWSTQGTTLKWLTLANLKTWLWFVTWPTTPTNNNLASYDGTTGKLIKDSGVKIDDTGTTTGFLWTAAKIITMLASKLNKSGELRTGNGTWKVIYNNGSGNEVELPLWNADTYLKSNWPAVAPSFGNPPSPPDADETTKWIVERLTDIEFENWTDTTRFPNAVQVNSLAQLSPNTAIPSLYTTIIAPLPTLLATPTGGIGWTEGALVNSTSGWGISLWVIVWHTSSINFSYATGKKLRMKWRQKFQDVGASERQGMGLTLDSDPSTGGYDICLAQTDVTNGLIRFVSINGTMYACNSNGSNYNATDVSAGLTLTNWNTYEIVVSTTDIKYYINWVLKATHTTYIPTSGTPVYFGWWVSNLASTRRIAVSPVIFSIEN